MPSFKYVSLLLRLVFALVIIGARALAADDRIEVGSLQLDVYISRTATLFHIVDQLSEWSYYCHREYGRDMAPLSDEDRSMLTRHKGVRAKHSWGGGLEQTFYTPLSLEDALKNGPQQGWLTSEEASTEQAVMLHFAPRIDALLTKQYDGLVAFRNRLRRELIARSELIAQFARFTGGTPGLVPAYLIPNPDKRNIGGGYNGDRLVVEIPTEADAVPTLLHELFHAFIKRRKPDIEVAIRGVTGLDFEIVNEGLAYAFSPGLVHEGLADSDPLAGAFRRDLNANRPFSEDYTRNHLFGLALRPLLKEALEDPNQTLTTFLPRVIDVWRAINETEAARAVGTKRRNADQH